MFKRLETVSQDVVIIVNGAPVPARKGANLAATLLENGVLPFRFHDISAQPRAPYCMIGKCFDCLILVDGRSNTQGCMTAVRDGMRVDTQRPCKDREA